VRLPLDAAAPPAPPEAADADPRARARVVARLAIGAAPLALLKLLAPGWSLPPGTYLSIHVLVEFGIAFVAFATFAVQWYATRARDDARARFLAAASLAMAILEVCHALVFPGMPGFLGPSSVERGVHFWLVARAGITAALLASVLVSPASRHPLLRRGPVTALAAGAALAFVAFESTLPPVHGWLHVPGRGLTPLKVALEASIAALAVAGAALHLRRHRATGDATLSRVAEALGWIALAEVCFSLYASANDVFNLLGHAYSVAAAWRIFDALFVDAILRPYARLDEATRALAASNERLTALRDHVEGELATTIARLEETTTAADSARAELETAIASVPDGILRYAADGSIVAMNAGAQRLLHYDERTRTLSIDERWATLDARTPDGRPVPAADNPVRRALAGEVVRGIPLLLQPAGERRWVMESAAPVYAGGALAGAIAVLSDFSRVQELQSEREDLLRAVSHDLRNPLQIVLLQAERLQRLLPPEAEKERKSATTIAATARQMAAMIRDLVEAARLDAGRLALAPEPIRLETWIPERLALAAGVIDVARLAYAFAADLPPVQADPNRLDRVVANLVGNALKYSPPGSPVEVSAAADEREVTVTVRDRGVGIAAEDLPRLFERFFRGRLTQRADGLGLGLYIVRMLVEAHGGRVGVESVPGEGSAFTFTLPRA
jgi:signal transduction histidine kinase